MKAPQPPEPSPPGRIVIAGGSGFLGHVLARHWVATGFEVVVLSRSGRTVPGTRGIHWDGRTPGPWAAELEGARALVNLSGRTVNCRYHAANRREIVASRIDSTRVLGEAIRACRKPPELWLNSSTATIYTHSFDRPMDEATGEFRPTPAAKDAFSIEVAQAWEAALEAAETPWTRKVAMRSAMVLGWGDNSVLPTLVRLARWGLGGAMAGGGQYMSWIHERDFVRAVEWLMDHPELRGPVNLASPHPLPNVEFMREIRRSVGRRIGLPATAWMIELGTWLLRSESELVIKSRRVVPTRLLQSGFRFEYPQLVGALADLCGRPGRV